MDCIFCRKPAEGASTSHILPDSLGGGEWACLPDGLVCSSCNQYFGTKVENLALGSFPFLPFRLSLRIPTKKNRAPVMESYLGNLRSGPLVGQLGIEPRTPEIEAAIKLGEITQFQIVAEPTEPLPIARMLVKMGLEVIATDSFEDAHHSRFDSARTFARAPQRGVKWWWSMHTNHEELSRKFRLGVTVPEWQEGVSLSIQEFEEFDVFRLQLLDMVLFTPLDGRVLPPDMTPFPEPDYRLFEVTC